MLNRIVTALLTQLASLALEALFKTKAMKKVATTSEEIDRRIFPVKEAIVEVLDGQPMSKEQGAKLKASFKNLIK